MHTNAIDNVIEKSRKVLRVKHMALKTEKTYTGWIARYCRWLLNNSTGTHEQKLYGYLSYLANDRNAATSIPSPLVAVA